jgi:hypothetical protein
MLVSVGRIGRVGGTRQRLVPAVTPAPTPTLTMAQLADTRMFQRATTTGSANSKGAGTVTLAITIDQPATIEYRLRDAVANGNPTLQDWTSAGSVAADATAVSCPNVPARLGWYLLDVRANGGAPVLGKARIGMGRVIAMSGQSQAVRQFGKMPSYTGTNASLGVAIEPNSAVYARYSDSSRSVTTPAWAIPADASNYDSTFAAEFLRRQVADRGVNCAMVGHSVGSTAIAAWQPGQQNNTDLRAVLDAVGGFEAFYWHHGGDDAGAGTSAGAYKAGLSAVFGDLNSHNAARGSSIERYVTTMATRTSGGAGNTASVQAIRVAASEWAASNGAVYLEPHDVTLEDAVHQGQPGNITFARHLHRATTAATDNGPAIVSGTRAAAGPIVLTTSAAVALIGTPTDRFAVYPTGTLTTALAIAGLSVSGATITLNLSADPGNAQALDVYWLRHPDPSGTTAAANMIYDTYTSDGLPNGRQLQPTLGGPVVIAAPGGTPTPTPTPTPSVMKDTFTGADGTNITSRPTDTGQSWSSKSGTWTIAGNRARADGSGVVMLDSVVSSPNYDVEGDLTFVGGGANDQNAFIIGHGSQDGANRFQAGFYGSLGRIWSIGVVTGNGYSNKTDVPASSVTNDVTYHVKVQFRLDTGTNRVTTTLIVDGVTIGSYVGDAGTYTAAGYTGFRQSGSSNPTATTGTRWDNFTVTPA